MAAGRRLDAIASALSPGGGAATGAAGGGELQLGPRTMLQDRAEWVRRGIKVPSYDPAPIRANTRERARWLHFAPSNLFVAEIAPRAQLLIEQGLMDTGIVGVEAWDAELVTRVYREHDNLRLRVVMPPAAENEVEVIASVADTLTTSEDADWQRVLAYFAQPSLQMVSVTCTEKGYGLGFAKKDMEAGPSRPGHLMAVVASCAWHRFTSTGGSPIAFVSMDNCSENGKLFRTSVTAVAQAWQDSGKLGARGADFLRWLKDPSRVSFPWTMIDRISPYPGERVERYLREAKGISGMTPIKTAKHGVFAPFANTEHVSYLVIQDSFPNGRPPLDKTGVIFCNSEKEVGDFERMKVGTCLNPLHTTLSTFGVLLGHSSISGEMQDADIVGLLQGQARESLPKAVRPASVTSDDSPVAPGTFLRTCMEERFPNPNVPDTPQRIVTDTSQKVGVRYGNTLNAYGSDAASLVFMPLAVAGWVRYLVGMRPEGKGYVGTDDAGKPLPIEPDPKLEDLAQHAGVMKVGNPASITTEAVAGVLRIGFPEGIPAGVAERVAGYVKEMSAGTGAVRATVRRCLAP